MDVKLYLVANQSDLSEDRIISYDSAKYASDNLGMDGLFDISATRAADVIALFNSVISDKTEALWPVSVSHKPGVRAYFLAGLVKAFSSLPLCR